MKKIAAICLAVVLFGAAITPISAVVSGTSTKTGNVIPAVESQEDANNILFNENQSTANGYFQVAVNSFMSQIVCQLDETGCGNTGGGRSASASLTQAVAYLYSPPANTQIYIADLMNSAGLNIAQPAYAQGLGFSSLDPILDTWKAFRNVAYLFYVILFLVIGFMIMFRQKISSQAVVTAQQALPNIIISLIAVTFSYAIAGLLIDAMYIVMFLIVGLFPAASFGSDSLSLREIAMDRNIFQIGFYLLTGVNTLPNAYDAVRNMITSALEFQLTAAEEFLGFIGGLTFAVVFALATMFGIFRLFFELLKTYISIIISIVLAPFALMMGALPGNNAFQAWLKTLVANLAVFPGILVVLVIAFMIIGGRYSSSATSQVVTQVNAQGPAQFFTGSYNGGFLPPYIPGSGSGSAISIMLGLGIILIMPDLVGQIKKSLGGSGGIFEQFANNFQTNLEKGWKGGELVPGVGFSNTNNFGMTGRNVMSKLWRGTKESRERADKGKFNVLGRGVVGSGLDVANPVAAAGAYKFKNWLANRNATTGGGTAHGGAAGHGTTTGTNDRQSVNRRGL